jgi:uncharacterized protein YidB (DUF937 family)
MEFIMLEKLVTEALQGFVSGQDSGNANPLLQIIGSLLSNSGQSGGLAGLVEQFGRAGLGQQMQSWISTGRNMPISADQIAQVFGHGGMQQMAQQAGMDPSQFGGQMAEVLPQMIDKLTPNGELPQGGVEDALNMLGKLMQR